MKKILFIGIIGLLACSAVDVNAASPAVENVLECTAVSSSKPKVITKGDLVIIIYSDRTTIVVDKDGTTVRIPPR